MRNFYTEDPNLATLLKAYLEPGFFQWAEEELVEYGALCAKEIDDRARHTDREGQPKLVKYDKMGNDISFVWQNEGYLKTVKQTYDRGIVGYVHKEIPALGHKGNYIYSFAQGYLLSQSEPGFYCPVTLTMATAYLIDHYADEKLKEKFLPHVLATGDVELYEGATFLTERQGGSDVGANETRAVKEGDHYRLTGEKYFASNAGACGVAMVLARIDDQKQGTKGLSLFLVPWKKDDGSNNNLSIRRLKDKLGVKAVPSAEVLLEGSKAYLVGDASKGFSYMAEALNLSRLCNAVASVGIMQRAYLEAKSYAYERNAFKQELKDFPMIRESLVNMKVKHEVEMSALFTSIALFERVTSGESSEEEQALNRLLIALVKKETAEQAVHFSHEAIEMHGGNGYIEDFVTPRLLRDAQVLTVWEGTANILGLEVLRLIHKYEVHQLFFARMKRELDDLPENLALEKTKILKAIDSAHARINQIAQMDQSMQTYHSKRMTKWLSDIFESTIALKDAAQYGERKQAIARIFIERTLQSDLYLLSELALKHYELIVEKTPVSSELQRN
ncbi:acyl-CoA dehydrogenase family protein [Alkalihalobacillus macyae]|uniref:acyl-CoA dehydrogenase family protein n=1 Tax=Guptibacillus hwajinpoensis TaxID=208199 RepID=UPI00273AC4BA|nr:acyl-CoA dehydrogenase family protein [Alkalihalobacillus macyae]MDP4551098.1 acyl-CoA dehydrogenase family protein [Alkalihalobacillus macyae]